MEISRKTDYALRMLAELVNDPGSVVPVRAASRENGVPYSFARSIQHDLAAAGIVENVRGSMGGMRLAVDPREATLLQLVEAVQGPVIVSECVDPQSRERPCPRRGFCHFNPVWCTAEAMLRQLFSSVTLYQLVVDDVTPCFEGSIVLRKVERESGDCPLEGQR